MSETSKQRKHQPMPATAAEQAEESTTNVAPGSAYEAARPKTSERKKQANRDNSKRSTGPKTNIGKFWVRYNALKHGLYVSDVVIRGGDGKENQEEFDIFLEGLRRAWEPQDVMQDTLVRTIAECDWRLRRALRAEVGEIRRQTDSYYARLDLNFWDESNFLDDGFWSREDVKASARENTFSIKTKLGVLESARKDLDERGCIGEGSQKAIDSTYGSNSTIASRCHRLSQLFQYQQVDQVCHAMEGKKEDDTDPIAAPDFLDEERKALSRYIDRLIATLKDHLSNLEQAEDRENEAVLLAYNLPDEKFVNKLIRYETLLVNRKEKAIRLLLRLQGK